MIKPLISSTLQGEVVSNHDELMSNFFAQADALALGKTPIELRSENVRFRFNGRKLESDRLLLTVQPVSLLLMGWLVQPSVLPSECKLFSCLCSAGRV